MDDGKQMVMVMEYLRGGQLLDCLEELAGEHYTEQAAAAIFQQASLTDLPLCSPRFCNGFSAAQAVHVASASTSGALLVAGSFWLPMSQCCLMVLTARLQMASALECLHDLGIMDRDVKGENFIFALAPAKAAQGGQKPVVKLIDLGMSAEFDPKAPIRGSQLSLSIMQPASLRLLHRMAGQQSFSVVHAQCVAGCTWSCHEAGHRTLQGRWGRPASWRRRSCSKRLTRLPWTSSPWGWCCSSCWSGASPSR